MVIVAIYEKMFRLPQAELNKSAAVSLMSTDMSGVELLVSLAYTLGASIVELGLGIYILATIVGAAWILVVLPAFR